MTVGGNGRVRLAAHVHAREFQGELVLLQLERGDYFGLDPLGARVWKHLLEGATPSEIVGKIGPDYDVAPDRLLSDLIALTDDLVARGLVEVCP